MKYYFEKGEFYLKKQTKKVIIGLLATVGVSLFIGWPVSITLYSIVISFLVCTITGVFFGWYPARKAAELEPISALRYE